MSLSIMLLKRVTAEKKASAVGKAFYALGKAGRGAVRGAGDAGAALAHGVGADPAVGRVLGLGAAGGGSVLGAKKLKRKKDEWMYRHGFSRGY